MRGIGRRAWKQVTSMYSVSSRKKKWTITNWCFTPHKHPFKKKSILFVFFRWWTMKNIGEGGWREYNFPIYYLGLNSWNCHAQALPQCVRKPESMILIKWPYSWPLGQWKSHRRLASPRASPQEYRIKNSIFQYFW